MRFFEMRDDMGLRGVRTLGDFCATDSRHVFQWDFGNGKVVDYSGDMLAAEVAEHGQSVDVCFNTWNTMIVSQKAKQILEIWAPRAIQYVPLRVPGDSGTYFVANIIVLVNCLDEKLSHVERFSENDTVSPERVGEISLVVDLHVDAEKAANYHLFRIEGYPVATIVSESLKSALQNSGITGVKFDHVTSPDIADFRIKWAQRQRRRAL
jgi:hypothetical protein